jgi:hypothetical protein
MSDIFQSLANNPGLLIPIIAIGGSFIAGTIAIIFGTIMKISTHSEHEKSRREIAAYVAEGSMSPDDGAKLLASNNKNNGKSGCG